MIITHLHAENVLKYARLSIDNIPDRGLIGISGQNESGKSSIGETICFALFGRTFSLDEESIHKIIRWSEGRCQVSLGFRTQDGKEYEVNRYLDNEGNHSARLSFAGQTHDPICRGVEAVDQTLRILLGIDYGEFIESFYLAQREISAPHPHSDAVKTMAGVLPLEQIRVDFTEEIAEQKAKMVHADENHIRVQGEIEALGFQPGRLENLEQLREQLIASRAECDSRGQDLAIKTEQYVEALGDYNRAKRTQGKSRTIQTLLLLVGGFAALVWLMLNYFGNTPAGQQVQGMLSQLPQWQDAYQPWLVYTAAGTAILAGLLWMQALSAGSRVRKAGGDAAAYASMLEDVQRKRSEGNELSLLNTHSGAISVHIDDGEAQNLRQKIVRHQAFSREVEEAADAEKRWIDAVVDLEDERIATLGEEVSEERDRRTIIQGLQQEQADYQQMIDQAHHKIRVREQGLQLLEGSMDRLALQFNRELREGTAQILPDLTDNRYQHVKLDDELNVQVFSADKGDFMEFDEVSSGTQRQILLAVRLVMSHTLARDTVRGDQFVFLDEPFAFFDHERTRNSLKALDGIAHLPQIWVVSQEYSEGDGQFAKRIECNRTDVELIA